MFFLDFDQFKLALPFSEVSDVFKALVCLSKVGQSKGSSNWMQKSLQIRDVQRTNDGVRLWEPLRQPSRYHWNFQVLVQPSSTPGKALCQEITSLER
jgi:hypothetical protein